MQKLSPCERMLLPDGRRLSEITYRELPDVVRMLAREAALELAKGFMAMRGIELTRGELENHPVTLSILKSTAEGLGISIEPHEGNKHEQA
jgi:hypothetical protein